jgi:hypothetical protein
MVQFMAPMDAVGVRVMGIANLCILVALLGFNG